MSKLPLLTELPQRILDDPYTKSVYTQCLGLEKVVQSRIDAKQDVGRSMIYCRILGYLLIHAPNDQARAKVRRDIVSATTDQAMLDLGAKIFRSFRKIVYVHSCVHCSTSSSVPVRSTKGPVPIPSRHPSRPSFDTLAGMIKEILQEAPQSHSVGKMQVNSYFSLVRGFGRCDYSRLWFVTAFDVLFREYLTKIL